MRHPEYWPLIEAHADGNLQGGEADRLLTHLQECEDCARRLSGARRESSALQRALAAPVPPENMLQNIMAAIEDRGRSTSRLRYGLLAGVAANVLTAALLLALSLGAGAPFGEMLLLATAGALIWGGIKGLAFVQLLPFLPRTIVYRAAVFGFGSWVITVLLLALSSIAGATSDLSTSFLLAGSLTHSLMYALLLSWMYEWFIRGRPPGLPMYPTARAAGTALLIVALMIMSASGAHAGAPGQAVDTGTATPTATQELATETPTETVSPTPSPRVPATTVSAETPTVTDTPLPATPSSVATPSPTTRSSVRPTAVPRRHGKKPSRNRPILSARVQVRSILPSIVSPGGHRSTVQRVHDVIVLLNFL